MQGASFACVRLPGADIDQIEVFRGPKDLVAQPIENLNDWPENLRFICSAWNSSDTFWVLNDYLGSFSLAEAFGNFSEFHSREQHNQDTTFEDFQTAIQDAQTTMRSFELQKVVLARQVTKQRNISFSELRTLFESLCMQYPQAFVYVYSTPMWGTWMGASPETLVNYENGEVSVMSLAGTLFNEEEKWSEKESSEQAVTSDFIKSCLDWKETEKVQINELRQGSLRHLLSIYKKPFERNEIPDLIRKISPTPAVCGSPSNVALQFISQYEGFERDLYAGFIGVQRGDALFTNVNLRCAEIAKDRIRLLAGCGINLGSDPAREWEESTLKMSVIAGNLK